MINKFIVFDEYTQTYKLNVPDEILFAQEIAEAHHKTSNVKYSQRKYELAEAYDMVSIDIKRDCKYFMDSLLAHLTGKLR